MIQLSSLGLGHKASRLTAASAARLRGGEAVQGPALTQ